MHDHAILHIKEILQMHFTINTAYHDRNFDLLTFNEQNLI